MTDAPPKRPRGRPLKHLMPEPIPDAPESIARRTRHAEQERRRVGISQAHRGLNDGGH